MSTATLNYPDVVRVRRAPAIGRILILSTLALIGITLLPTVISANVALSNRAAVSQNSIVPISVPVLMAPTSDNQPVTLETPMPSSVLISQASAVPVPVPTPPSQ